MKKALYIIVAIILAMTISMVGAYFLRISKIEKERQARYRGDCRLVDYLDMVMRLECFDYNNKYGSKPTYNAEFLLHVFESYGKNSSIEREDYYKIILRNNCKKNNDVEVMYDCEKPPLPILLYYEHVGPAGEKYFDEADNVHFTSGRSDNFDKWWHRKVVALRYPPRFLIVMAGPDRKYFTDDDITNVE